MKTERVKRKRCKKGKTKEKIWENRRKEAYSFGKRGKKSTSNFRYGEKNGYPGRIYVNIPLV